MRLSVSLLALGVLLGLPAAQAHESQAYGNDALSASAFEASVGYIHTHLHPSILGEDFVQPAQFFFGPPQISAETLEPAIQKLSRMPYFPAAYRAEIANFYTERALKPVFIEGQAFNAKAAAVIALLKTADEYGLDPRRYMALINEPPAEATAEQLAYSEVNLLAAAMLYAHDARGGRVVPYTVSPHITAKRSLPDPREVLAQVGNQPNPSVALEAWQPDHKGFLYLKDKLLTLKKTGAGKGAEANIKTQQEIILNMERWRWLPTELGRDHIFVNVPSYKLNKMQNDNVVFTTRVVVGKPETPTPIFSDKMQYLILNPAWNVPTSIANNELIPLAQKNPRAIAARGLQVVSRGKVVDPASVDWSSAPNVSFRQPPGERNALGYVKFMFPNDHAVYLHDTPSRALFNTPRRVYSHGCVRVDAPFKLAENILAGNSNGSWSEEKLQTMIGGPERKIDLSQSLPIHLAYFTMEVSPSGQITRYEDIYGHDQKIRRYLGFGG